MENIIEGYINFVKDQDYESLYKWCHHSAAQEL